MADLYNAPELLFQSTLPVGGGTAGALVYADVPGTISIHPPRGGRDCWARAGRGSGDISIHPPRGGRDP